MVIIYCSYHNQTVSYHFESLIDTLFRSDYCRELAHGVRLTGTNNIKIFIKIRSET